MSLYEKLPTSGSIRVLRLARDLPPCGEVAAAPEMESDRARSHPGFNPICCEMLVISLAACERYDALSYVWGDPSVRDSSMICNGRRVKMTPNLWSALHQVWTNWPNKTLWVDALCINQHDIPERNQHVAMMGNIYSKAEHVIIWLGEQTQKSRCLFEVFEKLKNGQLILRQSPVGGEPPGESAIGSLSQNALESVHAKQPTSIAPLLSELFSRPWFSRAWTLQEIKLARRAVLCCGSLYDDFSLLSRAIDKHNESESMAYICGLGYIGNPIPEIEENVTLFNLLVRTEKRKATDHRDKIYSLLSLLPRGLYDFLEPDYSLSEEETIIWASRIFMDLDGDTACLSDAGLSNRRDDTLPSWAVDWRYCDKYEHQGRKGFPDHLRNDSRFLRARFEYGRNLDRASKKLELSGWGFGRIEVDEAASSAFLTGFPDCALQSVGAPMRDCRECHGLSPEQLSLFCKKIKQHDDEHCTCMDNSSRVVYSAENLPGKTRDGDWLWRHAYDTGERVSYVWDESGETGGQGGTVMKREKIVKTVGGLRASRMNDGHDFMLHPVNNDGEVNFQVVGEAWGYGIRGLTPPTRFTLSLRHPESTVIISNFNLI